MVLNIFAIIPDHEFKNINIQRRYCMSVIVVFDHRILEEGFDRGTQVADHVLNFCASVGVQPLFIERTRGTLRFFNPRFHA
jgi:hypothetical protein